MFPFVGMPKAAQAIAEALPLTHFVRLIRGIMLRGAEIAQMAKDVYAPLRFMLVAIGFAIIRCRKRLEQAAEDQGAEPET